jgi:hypothetical protein
MPRPYSLKGCEEMSEESKQKAYDEAVANAKKICHKAIGNAWKAYGQSVSAAKKELLKQ